MSQMVYTELEAFPLRWPYLQLEPLDASTTKTWPSDQTFNSDLVAREVPVPSGTGGVYYNLFGSTKFGQVWKRQVAAEFWENLQLYGRRVGDPGNLVVEIFAANRSETTYNNSTYWENLSNAAGSDSVSTTTWRAVSRLFPRKLRIAEIRFRQDTSGPNRFQIRNAESDGRPGSTIIADVTSSGTQHTFNPPLELNPGLYSFIFFTSSGTANLPYNLTRASASDFGSDHSTWVSTNSGSSWSSAGRTNYYVILGIRPLAYVPTVKLAEWTIPQTNIGTTLNYYSLMPTNNQRILHPSYERIYVFISAPSGNSSNYYEFLGYTHYFGMNTSNPASSDDYIGEHRAVFDGTTWNYFANSLSLRKTYWPIVADTFSNTYFIGPGSYSPRVSIQIKANSGTVFARAVVLSDKVLVSQTESSEKSTTSTTYVTLSWDTANNVPEIRSPSTGPVAILLRGNGAYNQTSYEPRIYYDKNPVTPRDFGFTELYLMRVRADENNTLVRFNDKTNVFFASAGDSVVIDPNFRAPVGRIQVVRGRATCDMLGVV